MAMSVAGTLSPNIAGTARPGLLLRAYFEAQFLKALEKDLLVKELLGTRTIPSNSGKNIIFHRIQNFVKQTTGISEAMGTAHMVLSTTGGALKSNAYSVDAVNATLGLFGNDLQLSELLTMTSEPNPMPELSRRFLFNGVDTLEQLSLNLMVCSSVNGISNTATAPSIDYGGASASVGVVWGDGSTTLTEATLAAANPIHRIAAESFNVAYARLRSTASPFHPKLANRRYAGLVSPGIAGDLRTDATFQEIALKGQKMGESKFESASIGDVFGVVVMETPNAAVNFPGTIDATNDEIVRCVVFGDEYAMAVDHAKGVGKPRVTYIPPTPSAADPYGNMGFLTWKFYFAGQVVNPLCGQILKVATNAQSPSITAAGYEWGAWV